jgi:hypothetical protein
MKTEEDAEEHAKKTRRNVKYWRGKKQNCAANRRRARKAAAGRVLPR